MYIPKDTALVLNCYEMHHNEERYPDPYVTLLSQSDPVKFNVDNCAPPNTIDLLSNPSVSWTTN